MTLLGEVKTSLVILTHLSLSIKNRLFVILRDERVLINGVSGPGLLTRGADFFDQKKGQIYFLIFYQAVVPKTWQG